MGFDLTGALFRLLALIPALTVHEFCHAYFAMRAGDPTPAAHGRVTLNPLAHLDPIGTICILFAPIGWAKPVPINPANFRHPSRDIVVTSAAGPLSNIAQVVVWALVLRFLIAVAPSAVYTQDGATLLAGFLGLMVYLNFILAIFNLIPLGPLDGHHIAEYTLPYRQAMVYRQFNQRYGYMALILGLILLFTTPIGYYLFFLPASSVGDFLAGENVAALIHSAGIRW